MHILCSLTLPIFPRLLSAVSLSLPLQLLDLAASTSLGARRPANLYHGPVYADQSVVSSTTEISRVNEGINSILSMPYLLLSFLQYSTLFNIVCSVHILLLSLLHI